MHYVMRSRNIIISLILVLVLASCSTSAPTVKPPASDGEIYYIAKVDISASDSQKAIESKYGAKAVFFNTEAGFAVLGFTKEAGELTSLTTTENQDAYGIPEVTAQGYSTWAGGFNAWAGGFNAWAGGYDTWAGGFNTWAGGYDAWAGGYDAWAGGYTAWAGGLPMNSTVGDNIHVWDRINLAEGQLRAPNLGEGVVVAVLDTGIDATHPRLSGNLTPMSTWKDYVDNDNNPYDAGNTNNHGHGHGTAIASLVLKVAPNAKIMPIRVLDRHGNGDTDELISALTWAVNQGADVINLSLGTNVYDFALSSVVDWISSEGVFIVTSAGNSNSENVTYPARYTNSSNRIISVGSVNLNNEKSSFSNYGYNKIDIVVPGEGLSSAFPGSKKASVKGTSFAAPLATGAIALALGQNPNSSYLNLMKSRISSTATDISSENPNYITKLGGGLLNIEKFLKNLGNSAPSPSRKALFVVGSLPLNASDEFFKERLEQLGFLVTNYRDSFVSAAHANGKDLVVISSTVSSDVINSKFRDVAVPVITWEDNIFGDMSLTWSNDDISGQTSIKINTSHPLSAGFAKYNTVKVYNYSNEYSENRLAYGKVYSSAIKVATVPSDSSKVVVFAYEKGAALGTIWAPAKRVGMFFQNYDDLSVNNYGAAFFDAAVVWATNDRYEVVGKTWLEAESPSSTEGGFIWGSGSSGEISGGSYMTTPESHGDDYAGNTNVNLNYKLKVENSGSYYVWVRGYGPDYNSDSFFVQTDGGSKQIVSFIGGDWRWKKVSKYFSAGEHTLTISLREDGTKLDKILITSDSNYTPSGLGLY